MGRYAGDNLLNDIERRICTNSHLPGEPGAATISVSVRNATHRGLTNLHHDHNAAAMTLMEYAKAGRKIPLTELRATWLGYLADTDEGGETIFPCICDRNNDKHCKKAQ